MSFWSAIAGLGLEAVKLIIETVTQRMGDSTNVEKLLNIVDEIGAD